ncbi:MAG: MarR family transcriptional regulator [Streptosporangiales bacterium]|nr:MarR family transcriptional regulator [Streptosporangiales bacterium]
MTDSEKTSAARLLATLEELADPQRGERGGVGVSELARRLQRDKSIVSRQLRSLVEVGLVDRLPDGQHRLGWRLFALAASAGDQRVREQAPPVMRRLVDVVHERVHLSVLRGREALTVHCESPQRGVEPVWWVGRTSPLHCTATGRVLMFDYTDDEVRETVAGVPFDGLGPNAPHNVDELLRRLHRARSRGYASVDRESDSDSVAAAAPVRDHGGGIVAALNISAPSYRLRGRLTWAGQQVAAAAAHLSQCLGRPSTNGRA